MPKRILVVDDHEPTRVLLEVLLRAQAYKVFSVSDGLSALQKWSEVRPDLVLLDVQMPGLDGLELCRRLKGDPESRLTPVVLLTAYSDREKRLQGIKAGADDLLSKPIDGAELLARVRSLCALKAYTDELERAENVLFALARSIEGKDPYTRGHCERLSEHSARLGERIGLPEEQLLALRRGGVLHDIGKVAVPDAILLKPGRLTAEEMGIMQEHPVVGERICAPLKSFHLVLPIIRHHHERYDGSGYPDGLRGEEIPLSARVLQLVDVYDALTTERPYKKAFAPEQSLAIMEEEVAKGWWDPLLFRKFALMIAGGEWAWPAAAGALALDGKKLDAKEISV